MNWIMNCWIDQEITVLIYQVELLTMNKLINDLLNWSGDYSTSWSSWTVDYESAVPVPGQGKDWSGEQGLNISIFKKTEVVIKSDLLLKKEFSQFTTVSSKSLSDLRH